jgi:hypothetical protein
LNSETIGGSTAPLGLGGTLTAGGSSYDPSGYGTLGQGGSSEHSGVGGVFGSGTGGGGGGYYGGSAGGASGNVMNPGGGGSSYVDPSGTNVSMTADQNNDNGSLTIAPTMPIGLGPVIDGANITGNIPTQNLVGNLQAPNLVGSIPAASMPAPFTITSSGSPAVQKVGIGTVTPEKTLHIAGPGDQELMLESTTAGGHKWTIQSNASSASLHSSLQVIDRSLGQSRIGIDSAGQVGIGTTNPNAKLDVNGTLSATHWASENASANGYARMGGILMQWGTVNYTSVNAIPVTFPIAFANVFSITGTVLDAGGGSGANVPCKITVLTNTGFSINGTQVFSNDGTSKVKWIAIGN